MNSETENIILTDTLSLKIEKDLTKPLLITFTTTEKTQDSTFYPKIFIDTIPGVKATIIERYIHTGKVQNSYTTNTQTTINLAPNSNIEYIKIQDECLKAVHSSSFIGKLEQGATLNFFPISIGANGSTNKMEISLLGQNAEANIYGFYQGRNEQRIENSIIMDHASPNSISTQRFKAILENSAKGAFTGRVKIAKNAIGSNANQLHRALLLSDQASCLAKPELEVNADDVKCGHGATVGQISEEELFYLMSRGIPRKNALKLLFIAFTQEIIDMIENNVARNICELHLSKTYDKKIKQQKRVCK